MTERRKAGFRRATSKRHGGQINLLKNLFAQSSQRKSRRFVSRCETCRRTGQFHSRVVHHCYRLPSLLSVNYQTSRSFFSHSITRFNLGHDRSRPTQRHDRRTNRVIEHRRDKTTLIEITSNTRGRIIHIRVFLLVSNTKLYLILHHFQDIAHYWSTCTGGLRTQTQNLEEAPPQW